MHQEARQALKPAGESIGVIIVRIAQRAVYIKTQNANSMDIQHGPIVYDFATINSTPRVILFLMDKFVALLPLNLRKRALKL